jgi:hypothetical protein
VPLHGAKHGGRDFYDETRLALVREFLARAGIAPQPRP